MNTLIPLTLMREHKVFVEWESKRLLGYFFRILNSEGVALFYARRDVHAPRQFIGFVVGAGVGIMTGFLLHRLLQKYLFEAYAIILGLALGLLVFTLLAVLFEEKEPMLFSTDPEGRSVFAHLIEESPFLSWKSTHRLSGPPGTEEVLIIGAGLNWHLCDSRNVMWAKVRRQQFWPPLSVIEKTPSKEPVGAFRSNLTRHRIVEWDEAQFPNPIQRLALVVVGVLKSERRARP